MRCSSAAPVSAISTTPTTGRSSVPPHRCAPRCTSTRRSRSREFVPRCTRASTTPSRPPSPSYGIGWHYESGVQFLRLALAGVFDRFPDLQVLLGHWGEVVQFYLDRADGLAMQAELRQSFSEYVRRNAYITAGGVYSQRYLRVGGRGGRRGAHPVRD